MSSIIYQNTCKKCQLAFEWIMPTSICITCLMAEPLEAKPFTPLFWQQETNAKVNTKIVPCKHTEDGYCLRPENDYCPSDKCSGDYSIIEVCPHHVVYLKVISSAGTCETTVEVCENCGEVVSEPKTDC